MFRLTLNSGYTASQERITVVSRDSLYLVFETIRHCDIIESNAFVFAIKVVIVIVIVIYILFTKLPWPGDSEGTFRSSSQAAICPPVYHTQRRLHTVPLIAERQAGKL